MSRRDNDILIQDMLESCFKINKYVDGLTFTDFHEDDKTIDAVIRNFEIIGEAANGLSEDFKDSNSSVDWHKIRGFRNRIVHDYAGVDLKIIWTIINEFLPNLIEKLKEIDI
ncbi:MAG: DUF86 domain-containing protein [Bacteroidetes bacterium]|nr:DUF86 domain-containing protein [Bacteroidota bacterium]